jgi:hypothetical protein
MTNVLSVIPALDNEHRRRSFVVDHRVVIGRLCRCSLTRARRLVRSQVHVRGVQPKEQLAALLPLMSRLADATTRRRRFPCVFVSAPVSSIFCSHPSPAGLFRRIIFVGGPAVKHATRTKLSSPESRILRVVGIFGSSSALR